MVAALRRPDTSSCPALARICVAYGHFADIAERINDKKVTIWLQNGNKQLQKGYNYDKMVTFLAKSYKIITKNYKIGTKW